MTCGPTQRKARRTCLAAHPLRMHCKPDNPPQELTTRTPSVHSAAAEPTAATTHNTSPFERDIARRTAGFVGLQVGFGGCALYVFV